MWSLVQLTSSTDVVRDEAQTIHKQVGIAAFQSHVQAGCGSWPKCADLCPNVQGKLRQTVANSVPYHPV